LLLGGGRPAVPVGLGAGPVLNSAASAADPAYDGDEGFDPVNIRKALEQAKWRRGKAAEILGVSPRTLYRWMKRLEL
jgi:transcriptional regulator of acetoin/glycerol metabolism